MTMAEQLIDELIEASDEPIEIAYRIPGKGGWKRKEFKTKKDSEKFIDKLFDKEGSDVEIRTRK